MGAELIGFGAGDLFLTPSGGTPQKVGALQEINWDIKFNSKKLYGSDLFPDFVARTEGSITGKAKHARFQAGLIAAILSGSTTATGMRIGVPKESTGVISGATYTAANATGFEDHGVRDENDKDMAKVASAPAAGQYAVNASGVYTFNSDANTKTYSIAYSYTNASGTTTTYNNQLAGTAPTFTLACYNTTPQGKKIGLKFFAVTVDGISFAFKRDDFIVPDVTLEAFRDPTSSAKRICELYAE